MGLSSAQVPLTRLSYRIYKYLCLSGELHARIFKFELPALCLLCLRRSLNSLISSSRACILAINARMRACVSVCVREREVLKTL